MINEHKPFAEVMQSTLDSFTAQSWQWDQSAPFGSIVTLTHNKKTLYAVVHQVKTGSMDPNRTPFVYQKTEQELKQEQPQIFAFLKTTFSCLILGYEEKGSITYTISPEPPKMHAFVAHPHTEALKIFFYKHTYMHTLFNAAQQIHNIDELLLALLRTQHALGILHKHKLHKIVETFSLLTGNDYRRLKLFLQRVQSIIEH